MQAVVTGFHAIEESVNAIQKSKKNPQNVKLFYSKVGPRVKKILATAKEAGVSSVQVENSKLDVKSEKTQQNEHISVTISIGLAQLDVRDMPEDLYMKADKALYDAKENGRNRVVVYGK